MAKINARGNKIFRNKKAVEAFDNISKDSDVYESGVDNKGNIYFAYMNGVVKRYTRRDFLKLAKQ